ncbi:MAG TPA: DUF192 domain-containing protein [Bacillota bacterium]|nr:DUF192 domain-containing protein [Bacillota bacterium]
MGECKEVWLKMVAGSSIRVLKADTFWLRFRGLLGKKDLPEQEGLLLEPCNNVHTVGMHFPIDIIFLSDDDRIIAVHRNVEPGRLCIRAANARKVLELAAGVGKKLPRFPGERLVFYRNSD